MGSLPVRPRVLVVAAIALALGLATVAVAVAQGGQSLRLKASESGGLKFDRSQLTARAGRVTLVMANPRSDRFPHAIAVQGRGLNKRGATVRPGGTSRVTVTLRRGTYAFYCPVDAHRQAGMRGRLVVR